ncbi:MAG: DMT family transporter [Chloroflexi bacterium]|nr:DMT family transporter [Chloroflexota bacterium]
MADARGVPDALVPGDAPDPARGLLLGVVAVAIFALGVPMTRLATGSVDAPQLAGAFVAFGRAVVAGVLSVTYLVVTQAPRPTRADRLPLAIVAGGSVIVFPLAMSVALRYVESTRVSAMLGFAPLATAMVAARVNRQPQPAGFWAMAVLGSLLVVAYPFAKSGSGFDGPGVADAILLGAVIVASFATVFGARLARTMPAELVASWSVALALPATIPLAILTWPDGPVTAAAWAGVLYVGIGTMWAGAFLWYRALAIGGTVRVSQLILVQPILGMLFAVPVLGEAVDPVTAVFGVAIIATVFAGRRFASRG